MLPISETVKRFAARSCRMMISNAREDWLAQLPTTISQFFGGQIPESKVGERREGGGELSRQCQKHLSPLNCEPVSRICMTDISNKAKEPPGVSKMQHAGGAMQLDNMCTLTCVHRGGQTPCVWFRAISAPGNLIRVTGHDDKQQANPLCTYEPVQRHFACKGINNK